MDKTKIRTGNSLSFEEREAMIKAYLTGNYTGDFKPTVNDILTQRSILNKHDLVRWILE